MLISEMTLHKKRQELTELQESAVYNCGTHRALSNAYHRPLINETVYCAGSDASLPDFALVVSVAVISIHIIYFYSMIIICSIPSLFLLHKDLQADTFLLLLC